MSHDPLQPGRHDFRANGNRLSYHVHGGGSVVVAIPGGPGFSHTYLRMPELERRARANTPADIRIAAPWFKPSRNETDLIPDYFLHETADWLVFPHELDALTPEEMRERRPEIAAVVFPDESDAA